MSTARSASPAIMHVDMDAFYASVEIRRNPALRDTPLVVAGQGPRGVVLSATYDVRALGVHAGQATSRARRLAPHAVFLSPDHDDYGLISGGVMEVLRSITSRVEPLSLDEAFLDLTGVTRRLGPPETVGESIRARILDEQGITCSVGIADNKFTAKLAGALAKPNGLRVVRPEEVVDFLHPLPVDRLWGVGERTGALLTDLGLTTIGDVAHTPVETLSRALGPAAGRGLHELAWGRDRRPVIPSEPERSIGAEETFPTDVDDPVVIRRTLLDLAHRTASRLRRAKVAGRTVTIKIRFADFTTLTRARTLREATDVGHEIYGVACVLHGALGLERARLRLVGIRVEGLVGGAHPRQLMLGERVLGRREAERAADAVRGRFGDAALTSAALLARGPRSRGRSGR